MGADSSTLQSIESLNSTLEGIEKKLFIIEDIHLHHERVVSQDNSVLISGKSIHGRAGTHLICGPILGTIGIDFVRILVEVDNDVELTCNVFQINKHLITSRYCFSISSFARKHIPVCMKINNLLPDTSYHIYVGGVLPKDIVSNYASFKTLSENNSDIRFILTYNGRIDKLIPGEKDLWNEVSDRIILHNNEDANLIVDHPKSVSSTESSSPKVATNSTSSHVSFLCHHGNLISIESILRSRSVQLLDLLSREDSNILEWEQILKDMEVLIRESYRSALTSPLLASILRRCGGIFIAGTDEAAALTTSLLAAQLPDDILTSMETLNTIVQNNSSLSIDSNYKLDTIPVDNTAVATPNLVATSSIASFDSGDNSSLNNSSKYLNREARRIKEEREKEEMEPVEVKVSRLNIRSSTSLIDDLETVEDSTTTPVIGGALRRFQAAEKLSKLTRSTVQEHLRKLLVGMIIRLARRVYWSYFRQLWDDNYNTVITHDVELEVQFREILKLQKTLQTKSYMFSSLEKSRSKLLKEFGSDNKALKHFDARIESLKSDILEVESCLRTAAIRCGEVEEEMDGSQVPNGACINLGTVCLLILESNWGWLGADQQLFYPPIKEIEIHEKIQTDLEKYLNASPSSNSVNVQSIVCLSSCPLLPFTTNLITNQSAAIPVSNTDEKVISSSLRTSSLSNEDSLKIFQFSSLDTRRILTLLAKWQQERPDRGVLLSAPVSTYKTTTTSMVSLQSSLVDAALGYAVPYATDSSGKEITSDLEFEKPENVMFDIWDRDRSKLQQILVGDMRRQTASSTSIIQDMALLQAMCSSSEDSMNLLHQADTTTDANTQFKSYYDSFKRCIRPCFWDVSFTQQQSSVACFDAYCIHDRSSEVSLALGPVVGSVSYNSAVVMIQVCESCPLELICVDQLTGAEFICSRFAAAGRPCFFLFEYLHPNRAYDVMLSPSSHIAISTPQQRDAIWSSFTTLRLPSYSQYEVDEQMMTTNSANVDTDKAAVHALRTAASDGNEQESMASFGQSSSDILHNESSNIQTSTESGIIPIPTALSMQSKSVINESSMLDNKNSISYIADDNIRILLLGSDKPSWRGIHSNSSLDRAYISNGISLVNEISNVLSQGWNGIDLVIHCGCSIDWATCIDVCLSILTQVETLRGNLCHSTYQTNDIHSPYVTSNSETNRFDVEHAADLKLESQLLQQAKEQLRNACIFHWGSTPHTRNILAHGNHYFTSSPLFDLLNLFHASSLNDLKRDLSSYCVHQLIKLLSEIQSEYQHQLTFHFDPSNSLSEKIVKEELCAINNLKFFDDGGVALFELQPNFAFKKDNLQRVDDKFIPMSQLKALEQLLFPVDLKNKNKKFSLRTLLLLSPIPLVRDDRVHTDYSNLNVQQLGVRYPLDELLCLLDLLSSWLQKARDIEREVIIITGGVSSCFTSNIFVDKKQLESVEEEKNPLKMKQICCGSLIGVYEGNYFASNIANTSQISLHQSLSEGGTLYSEHNRYKYNHQLSNNAQLGPQCGLLELPTKSSIYANSIKQQISKSQNQANISFVNQLELKSLFESNWKHDSSLRNTNSFIDNNNSLTINQSKNANINISKVNINITNIGYYQRPRLHENMYLNEILEKLKFHLHQKELKVLAGLIPVGTGSFVSIEQDPALDTIVQAIDNICKSNKNVFQDCYALYIQHNHFDAPVVASGIAVEHSILSILQWIICRLPLQARGICKVPSSFAIRFVWEYYVHKMKLTISAKPLNSAANASKIPVGESILQSTTELAGNTNVQSGNLFVDNVAASMEADVEYFSSLLQCCIEVQLVLEYKAFSLGLLD